MVKEKKGETAEPEVKHEPALKFILKGAASCMVGGIKFIRDVPQEVPPRLAERLRKSGLFEEGR